MTDQELLDFYEKEKDATVQIYRARRGRFADDDFLELRELIRLTRLIIDKEKKEEREKFQYEKDKIEIEMRVAWLNQYCYRED